MEAVVILQVHLEQLQFPSVFESAETSALTTLGISFIFGAIYFVFAVPTVKLIN